MSNAPPIIAQFGHTGEGHLAAQVEDLAWLAVPVASGLKMLSGWRLTKPMAAWAADDFFGADGVFADEAAFRGHVEEIAQHRRELVHLPRPEIQMRVDTPWGASQQTYRYADGILCHAAASHGGFHLSMARNMLVHALFRNDGGWYEEDGEWAKVAFSFPELFTLREHRAADRSLRNDYPDAWERIHDVILAPGDSRVKDERQFRELHAHDWIVVAAIRSDRHPGFVECAAKLGGNRSLDEARLFLVPAQEYQAGRFGFVIDEARHARQQIAA
jgi:hypothetical protein